MNNDLISREALKEHKFLTPLIGDYQQGWNDAIDAIIDNAPTVEPEDLAKIKEITERALRSQDPINLYKARALDDIAEILGIEIKEPEAEETDSKDQITIDDIIKEG